MIPNLQGYGFDHCGESYITSFVPISRRIPGTEVNAD
jgi:hypothetical protein